MSGRVGSITTAIISDGLIFNTDTANRASYPKTGTTATDTVGNITGSLTNGTAFSNNNEGIFDFDGTDDYIDYGDVLDFDRLDPFSVNAWIKKDSTDEQTIVGKMETSSNLKGWTFYFTGGTLLRLLLRRQNQTYNRLITTVQSGDSITDSDWHNVVCTYDGSSTTAGINLYIDGQGPLSKTESGTLGGGTSLANSIPLQIGARNATFPFNGNIASVQIYNRELSATEVLHNYNALKNRFV